MPIVPRAWLNDVLAGSPLSATAPSPTSAGCSSAATTLVAPRVGQTRSRAQQLPSHESGRAVVKAIYDRCRPDPVSFEAVAAELWRMSAEGRVELDLTRPSRDGGRDAIGQLFVGPTDDQIGLGQLADTG